MTDHIHSRLSDFLNRTAAKEPTPGGGAAAALVGASGAALGAMALRYSLAKAPELEPQLSLLESARESLAGLIDADCAAYAAVSAAYGLPRDTDEQKSARRSAIQSACRIAMNVPLGGMVAATDALSALADAVDRSNKNLLTDAATAAVSLCASVESLGFFVLVNANALGEDPEAKAARDEEARLRGQAIRLADQIRTPVRDGLRPDPH